jgi:hypothetical protein
MFSTDDGLPSEGEVGRIVFAELLFILEFLTCHLIDFNSSRIIFASTLIFTIVVDNIGRVTFVSVISIESRIWFLSGTISNLFSWIFSLIVDFRGGVLLL